MHRDYPALDRFIAERRTVPFDWGRGANDCVSYCGAAALAQTGHDHLKGLRWSSRAGAVKLLGSLGGLAAAISSRLPEVAPAMAQRGDIAGVSCVTLPGEIRLMVVLGELLIGPGPLGSEFAPRSAMLRAWSLG